MLPSAQRWPWPARSLPEVGARSLASAKPPLGGGLAPKQPPPATTTPKGSDSSQSLPWSLRVLEMTPAGDLHEVLHREVLAALPQRQIDAARERRR